MAAILTDQTTAGSSSTLAWAGGSGSLFVEGVFDGAEVRLEWKKYGSTWHTFDAKTTVKQPSNVAVYSAACDLRITVANVGTNTSITAGVE